MARLRVSDAAAADLLRLIECLEPAAPASAMATVELITSAIETLKAHPLIGRAAERGTRELVISRGRSGYLARYDFFPDLDQVLVLRIRHQREAGYTDVDAS